MFYDVVKQERSIPVDWKKIKSDYIAGGTSYRKLAEKYGVSFSTLKDIARKEKWTDLREKAQHCFEIRQRCAQMVDKIELFVFKKRV